MYNQVLAFDMLPSQTDDTLFPPAANDRKILTALFNTTSSTAKYLYRWILYNFYSPKTVGILECYFDNFGKLSTLKWTEAQSSFCIQKNVFKAYDNISLQLILGTRSLQ